MVKAKLCGEGQTRKRPPEAADRQKIQLCPLFLSNSAGRSARKRSTAQAGARQNHCPNKKFDSDPCFCNVIDDFNREGLGIEVDLSLPATRVIRALEQIIEWRGPPRMIRCDNGPEYISGALLAWAAARGIGIQYIQPGNPQQNAYIERYNRTVRYAWLARTLFDSIEQVQEMATRWLWTYNHERPNMALGGITPVQKLALAA